jgi:hypothetical protein
VRRQQRLPAGDTGGSLHASAPPCAGAGPPPTPAPRWRMLSATGAAGSRAGARGGAARCVGRWWPSLSDPSAFKINKLGQVRLQDEASKWGCRRPGAAARGRIVCSTVGRADVGRQHAQPVAAGRGRSGRTGAEQGGGVAEQQEGGAGRGEGQGDPAGGHVQPGQAWRRVGRLPGGSLVCSRGQQQRHRGEGEEERGDENDLPEGRPARRFTRGTVASTASWAAAKCWPPRSWRSRTRGMAPHPPRCSSGSWLWSRPRQAIVGCPGSICVDIVSSSSVGSTRTRDSRRTPAGGG